MVDDDWSYLVEWFWEGYGFKGRGKIGIRHEREGTIQMPWKKLRVHHEREGHEFHSCRYATENELAL
jgi:hypothetical protein